MSRRRLEMDGVKLLPQEELHSFITQLRNYKQEFGGANIHVPIQIVRQLKLKNKDVLLVAIKKASEAEIQEYNREGKK